MFFAATSVWWIWDSAYRKVALPGTYFFNNYDVKIVSQSERRRLRTRPQLKLVKLVNLLFPFVLLPDMFILVK